MATILVGAFWGALIGGAIGGVIGGISSAINGRSFIEGFADGLLSGAVTGAVTGAACAGIGLAGQAFGKGIGCLTNLAKAVKVTSQVTKVISLGMDGFDIVAMGIGLFDPNNPLVEINQKLHSSTLYNGLQIGVNALAIFTAGATMTAKCFVAGTMILTASGLVAIENIKVGDKVVSTNPDTFEVAEKTVVETYIRETTELVNLTINGELIKTTYDHLFYVKQVGFVNAGELYIGDKLLNSKGQILVVDDINYETTDIPITVYNFQVEDFHTYHVGENEIWVHNANYPKNPDDLLKQGYIEITPDGMKKNTLSREFYNSETGDIVRFDPGKPGFTGFEGKDHYHQKNPNSTGKGDYYLDADGNPVPKGSKKSHLLPQGD